MSIEAIANGFSDPVSRMESLFVYIGPHEMQSYLKNVIQDLETGEDLGYLASFMERESAIVRTINTYPTNIRYDLSEQMKKIGNYEMSSEGKLI
jgi:hypothetical protein